MVERPAPNCAIDFHPDGFTFGEKGILGWMSAGKGFLEGFLRHSGVDTLYCMSENLDHFSRFTEIAAKSGAASLPIRWIPSSRPENIAEPGCLYHPNPMLGEPAWQRRLVGQRAYSVCGVTHSLCSSKAMEAIGALAIAPVQPWDALVCTSQAGKAVVQRILEPWTEYLASRLNAEPQIPLELPVIPLGVDCDAYADRAKGDEARKLVREKLDIKPEEIAVLHFGRLTYHVKAHPLPLYVGLERAARQTGQHIHLIQCGWFASREFQAEFDVVARQLCPSVRTVFIDGRKSELPPVWHAADIFVSLPDNIQETFGLTPIEAMAAGLPQVVSDWDGYRETVRHGIDGFRVPTAFPAAGAGEELARRYYCGRDAYHLYVGHVGQATTVDVALCAEAFSELINNPGLRRQMGDAAQQRARECFDWKVVIKAYQDLFSELAQRRAKAEECAPRAPDSPCHPLRADPFTVFASYPSAALGPDSLIHRVQDQDGLCLHTLFKMPMMSFAKALLLSEDECAAMLERLSLAPRPVAELLEDVPDPDGHRMLRTVGWLAKAGLIRIEMLRVG